MKFWSSLAGAGGAAAMLVAVYLLSGEAHDFDLADVAIIVFLAWFLGAMSHA